MRLFLFGVLLALACGSCCGQDDYCFGKDTERTQTRHFTSKTAYQIIKGTHIDKQYLVPNCVPQKIWILHRHGTRLPTKDTIQKAPRLEQLRDSIVKNYRVLKTAPERNALCPEDLIALQMWKWNSSITVNQENYLTSQGYEDLRGTAKLYQKYFPDVLPKRYNNSYYLFRHTDSQRTTESFKAFAEGLFGAGSGAAAEEIPDKDFLLRPYDYCESWQTHNYKGPGSESDLFRKSSIWNATLTDISRRLGFKYTLEWEDVQLMYDICRYEQAWQVDRTSVWCGAFTPSQVSVLEYESDVKYYYRSGYGFELNTHVSCYAVQDMLNHLNSPSAPKVVAYFAHSALIQTLISALGMNKDDVALTAANYANMTHRRWRVSNIDPFAANFVAVKYQCDAEPIEKEKVIFFLNQNAVDLDWCQVGLCNWSDVLKRYADVHKAQCDSYYCGDGASTVGVSFASLMLVAIVYLINRT